VFNVLFVIGMCAVFSKEVLVLTWWPLARDSSYYIFSLGLLALFFGGPYPASAFQIEFWEALILFLAYLGYVFVMSKNVQLQKKVTKCCGKKPKAVQPMASYVEEGDAGASKDEGEGKVVNEKGEVLPSNPLIRPTKFRAGVLQMVLQEQDEVEQVRVKVVAQIVGDVSASRPAKSNKQYKLDRTTGTETRKEKINCTDTHSPQQQKNNNKTHIHARTPPRPTTTNTHNLPGPRYLCGHRHGQLRGDRQERIPRAHPPAHRWWDAERRDQRHGRRSLQHYRPRRR
jgi:Ca2+/Na+ antiporter